MKPHPKPVELYGDGFIGSGFPAEVQQMSAACNVAVQQSIPYYLREDYPSWGWMGCLIHRLALQTGRLMYPRGVLGFSKAFMALLSPAWSSVRPGLACREPDADHTPRHIQNWKQ